MPIDMHIHVIGKRRDLAKIDDDIYFSTNDNNRLFTMILHNMIEGELEYRGLIFIMTA